MAKFVAVLLAALAMASAIPLPLQTHTKSIGRLEPEEYRLPDTAFPIRYNVRLIPYIVEGDFTFDGDVQIALQTTAAVTNSITLHANKLTIDETTIFVWETLFGREIHVTGTEYDEERQFYTIMLGENLVADTQYTIRISSYKGILDNDMLGFYRSSYVENGETRWLATTQFESTEARRAFPCFDEPAMKATFTIHISRPENMRAISNMPQDGVPQLDTEHTDVVRYWDHFLETPRMSSYLIAFVVSDFVFMENAAQKLRIFAQAPMITQARYAVDVSPPLLNWLANFTGIPFTLPKMDEVAVPDFDAGAMENWGLVTYRERYILFEEGVSTTSTKQSIDTVIAHEYAHQWFGDLVTPKWWNNIWLNEGFATYFESFAVHGIDTSWRLNEQFVVVDVQGAMSVDASQTSHPMTNDVGSPASIDTLFDSISYSKGGSVIRMMKHIVSEDTFQKGLNRYLLANQFNNAVADDLFTNLDAQLHEDNPNVGDLDLVAVMRTWTLQMGYPVVTVTRDYGTGSAELKQERFILKFVEGNPDTHDYKWHIPLTYTTQSELDFESTTTKEWFGEQEETHTISNLGPENEWVLFNIQEIGYYRVNYDTQNWGMLTAHLKGTEYADIVPTNRAQLIDDSFNLARAAILVYDIPLALSQYLEQEIDLIPWMAAFNQFSFIDRKLINANGYDVFQNFLVNLVENLYQSVGFDEGEDDGHVLKLNRAQAIDWACKLGEESCVQKAEEQMTAWMATPDVNPVKPDVRSPVYCTALKNGGAPEWDFMWQQYLASTVSSESTLIIGVLGCSTDVDTLRSYLELAVTENSPIRRQDTRAAFASVYNQPQGVDVTLDFLIEDFENISQYFGGFNALGNLFINVANRCNTQEQADKMSKFLEDNETALGETAADTRRAIEIINENIAWQATNGQYIIDWISNNASK